MNLAEEAKEYAEEMTADRRYLHQHAEIHVDLPMTKSYVKEKLKEIGYEVQEVGSSGLVVVAGGEKPGKTFMLRADMDALPLEEQVDLPFKSETNYMHACGHDLHTSMLLGAARLLKAHEKELEGRVKLMFQPAEETLTGAKEMIDAGILENPKVDAGMMIHVMAGFDMPTGMVIYLTDGPATASSDWFDIEVKGKGGHGAMPHLSVDPLPAVSHIHLAIGELNSREVDPDKFLVATVGTIQGGSTGNVIPDNALMTGTIRTFDNEVREYAKKRIKEIAEGIAASFRCSASVRYYRECPALVNDKEVRDTVVKSTQELLGNERVVDASALIGGGRMGGSEDFAYVSEQLPVTMIAVSANDPELNKDLYPMHHPKVVFDEKALPVGAAVYANAALHWLKVHSA
jgi:hippurate hydrolase